MAKSSQSNGLPRTIRSFSRSPFTPLACILAAMYGCAALVAIFARTLTTIERLPVIAFLALFPLLALGLLAWSARQLRSATTLSSPAPDAEDLKARMAVVASLTAATTKGDFDLTSADLHKIVETASSIPTLDPSSGDAWKRHVLWVDDHPANNAYEQRAFEALGLRFTWALSTDEALDQIAEHRFAAIISDMGRRDGPREGYVLLDRLRKEGDRTPFFLYTASNTPEHKREARAHGAFGATNNPHELFEMVIKVVLAR
jgi:CheY-like chemotaxis protein